MADKPSKLHKILKELVNRTNTNTKRLRILEQRNTTMENRINSLEKFMSEQFRQTQKSITQVEKTMLKWDVRVTRTEGALREIMKNVKRLATTTKIRELEQLVEIYNPLKSNFTTKEEVQRMIEEGARKS
jgi:hypothetical protein